VAGSVVAVSVSLYLLMLFSEPVLLGGAARRRWPGLPQRPRRARAADPGRPVAVWPGVDALGGDLRPCQRPIRPGAPADWGPRPRPGRYGSARTPLDGRQVAEVAMQALRVVPVHPGWRPAASTCASSRPRRADRRPAAPTVTGGPADVDELIRVASECGMDLPGALKHAPATRARSLSRAGYLQGPAQVIGHGWAFSLRPAGQLVGSTIDGVLRAQAPRNSFLAVSRPTSAQQCADQRRGDPALTVVEAPAVPVG